MQHYTLNTAFLRQFNQDAVLYSWNGKQRYGNIRLRQFGGRKNEASSLGRLVTAKMDHSAMVGDLIRKLKSEDVPDTRKLFEFSHKLLGKFDACMKDESSTAPYYEKLLNALKPLMALIRTYQKNMQFPLLKMLSSFLTDETDKENAALLCSEDIDAVWELVRRYADEMHRYYDVFNFFLQQEPDDNCAASVISRVEHYLLKLMAMIGKVILHAEFLDSRLEEWNARIIGGENQEMYN